VLTSTPFLPELRSCKIGLQVVLVPCLKGFRSNQAARVDAERAKLRDTTERCHEIGSCPGSLPSGIRALKYQTTADLFGGSRGAGCPATLDACKASNMQETGNRVFWFRLIFGQDGQSIDASPVLRAIAPT
jgi:hypothetical protein